MIARARLLGLAAALLLAACSTGPGDTPPSAAGSADKVGPGASAEKAAPEEEPAGFLSEENQRVILLFYPAEDGETLLPEERVIFLTNTLGSQVKQAVSELLLGPQEQGLVAAFPRSTRLLAVFLLDGGTALIDLGSEAQAIPAGSAAELAAVYALVDTVVFNFPEIQRVQILIEGQEIPTLAGHVATSRPLRADLQRIDWTWLPEGEQLLHLDQPPGETPAGQPPRDEPGTDPAPAPEPA